MKYIFSDWNQELHFLIGFHCIVILHFFVSLDNKRGPDIILNILIISSNIVIISALFIVQWLLYLSHRCSCGSKKNILSTFYYNIY